MPHAEERPGAFHDTRVVERRSGIGVIAVVLLLVALISLAVWLFFIADEETRDTVIPDDVDVTLEIDVSESP